MFASLDIKAMTGTRIVTVGLTNAAAVICFTIAGAVAWPPTLALLAGAAAGGYTGAHVGRMLPAQIVRVIVLGVTLVTTVMFFVRAYGQG